MKYKFCLFALFYISILSGQEDSKSLKGIQIGINVTSVLSSFSGNGNFLAAEDFPLLFRFGKDKTKVRLGLGFVGSSSDFFDPITGAFRESTVQEGFASLGIQYDIFAHEKWELYIGVDGLGKYSQESIKVFDSSNSSITDTDIGIGVAGLIGFSYAITKRVHLTTESQLRGIITNTTIDNRILGNTFTEKTSEWAIDLVPPIFLYFNFSF